MNLLTGIGKIYNAVKYDFPVKACLDSVLEGADEFILTVCEDSEDDTVEFCKQLAAEEPRLKLIFDVWRTSPDEKYTNMTRLANRAIDESKSEWFWSLDMDEIMPIGESQRLRGVLEQQPKNVNAVSTRFYHLYFDTNQHITGKLYDRSNRVARKGTGWVSDLDGCGLGKGKPDLAASDIVIVHYGYLREIGVHLQKEIRFQTDLYKDGVGGMWPDQRLVDFEKQAPESAEQFWRTLMGGNDKIVAYDGPQQNAEALRLYGK